MKTFVIAEVGANHNRDWRTAKKLIYAAAAAGASAVKFQNYTSSKLYSASTPDFGIYKNIPALISSIELPIDWCTELKAICDDCGIEFMSTPFDEESVDLLHKIGVKRLKVAAFEASDTRLLKCVAETKLPIIFSAGIGTGLQQAEHIISYIKEVNDSADITVLHCNSSYPTPIKDINLGQMLLLKTKFGAATKVGLSDHTNGILIPPVAVALGAEVIEKHYTLSRNMQGPDHPFAIEPDELYNMCRNISDVESSLGTKNENQLTESEAKNEMMFATRSLIVKKSLKCGELLTEDNVTTKRPFLTGNIPASLYNEIVGKYLVKKDLDIDQMIKLEDIEKVENDKR